MKRPIAILGSILLSLSFAAQAVIVTPVDGLDGQTVVQGVYFGVTPAVRVTTDAGVPIEGIEVDFKNNGFAFFTDGAFGFSGDDFGMTDSNGIATTAALMGYWPGVDTLTIAAQTQGALPITVTLNVQAGGPVRFEMVSGSNQNAPVDSLFAQPWVARVFDANGNVVPYAAVNFHATTNDTLPSVTFDGEHSVWVRADANGIATSPVPRANLVSGRDEGLATTQIAERAVQAAFFAYHILSSTGGGGGTSDGCGRQGKGNGNCGSSPAHSGGKR